jgi:nucleoside 2-deoxyribosyltransferase
MIPKKLIYLAGPLFSKHERVFLEEIAHKLAIGLDIDEIANIFLPHRDAGDTGIHGKGRNDIFLSDIHYLDEAKVVVALLDGPDIDSGTAVELGYAYAHGKQVFGILTDWRRWTPNNNVENINNMVWGVCGKGNLIFRDIDQKLLDSIRRAISSE